MPNISYRIYPSLLDAHTRYLGVMDTYEKYECMKETPMSFAEYERKAFFEFIGKINREPFESVLADQGTCFNELVDSMIEGKETDLVVREDVDKIGTPVYVCRFKDNEFVYPIKVCKELAEYYKGAIPQLRLSAILPTRFGNVELYGVLDELMPTSVHDIKTTSSYSAGKFKHNAQHLVYPYLLIQNGNDIRDFEYNVVEMSNGQVKGTYTEFYSFVEDRDIPVLTERVENFIEFIEENRDLITDKKVFNYNE